MSSPSVAATALVALMRLRGVGRRAALRIVNQPRPDEDSAEYRQSILTKARHAGLSEDALRDAWLETEEHFEATAAADVQTYAIHDDGYPARLRTIPDPPAVLFVKGNNESLHAPHTVAVVGTREPTPYGAKVAHRSGYSASQAGFVVVSGLAHGCDTFGHEGCVEANGVGIAVLAHGLDRVYPAANRGLAQRLLENGGCLVSEYPIGVTPARTAFAERDRIQSGLSDGVLVIETDEKGGTMHTVRFAIDQGRPLACVSHPEKWRAFDKTRGNQKLIADRSALPIADGQSLVSFLEEISTGLVSELTDAPHQLAQQTQAQLAWDF